MGGFDFIVKFYPDYVLEGGKPATRSMEFTHPAFIITVGRDGKKIADRTEIVLRPESTPNGKADIRDYAPLVARTMGSI